MRSPDRLSQGWRDINSLKLRAHLLLALHWHCVCGDNSAQLRLVDDLACLSREDPVGDQCNNLLCAMCLHGLGSLGQGTASISHIVDKDGDLARDIADEDHAGDLVRTSALLVDEGELEIETVGNGSGTLGSTRIWRNDNAVLDIEVLSDPSEGRWLGIEVVNWDVEEALNLGSVKVHGDNVVAAGGLEHICDQLGRDWSAGLVFLVLARVWEVWNDGGDATGRGSLTSIDHDEELHETIVDLSWSGRLEDEDYCIVSSNSAQWKHAHGESKHTILITNGLADCDRGLLVGVVQAQGLCELNTEAACSQLLDFLSSIHESSHRSATSLASSG